MEVHQLTIYTGDLDQVQITGLFTWSQVISLSFYIHEALKVVFVILKPMVPYGCLVSGTKEGRAVISETEDHVPTNKYNGHFLRFSFL